MHIRTELVRKIKAIIAPANEAAIRSVDTGHVRMYWNVGRKIFEEEQQGTAWKNRKPKIQPSVFYYAPIETMRW